MSADMILMETEERFGVSISDEQAERARTVGDIVDGVLRLLAALQTGRSSSSPLPPSRCSGGGIEIDGGIYCRCRVFDRSFDRSR